MVANPTLGLRVALRLRRIPVARTFLDRRPLPRTLLKAIRIHQWAKNVLLLAPLLLSHKLNPAAIGAVVAAFFCFSFMASASYLVNDLLDIESDRRHPAKRFRPFAAGDLPVTGGVALALALIAASAGDSAPAPPAFALWLAVYILATTAYSFYLKQVALVDVLMLSGLYTLRLLAGGAATGTEISPWLAGFSIFLFLSLAMVKRFSELENLRERGVAATHGRGYLATDLEQIRAFGASSATAAVVVFTLYISRPDVAALYKHSGRLWLIVPLMLYWLYRVWLLGSRGEMDGDPVIFALRDRLSLLVGACVVAVAIYRALKRRRFKSCRITANFGARRGFETPQDTTVAGSLSEGVRGLQPPKRSAKKCRAFSPESEQFATSTTVIIRPAKSTWASATGSRDRLPPP